MRKSLRPILLIVSLGVPFFSSPADHAAVLCLVNGHAVTTNFVGGTPGNDIIDCSLSTEPVAINAGAGNDRVVGGQDEDAIQGGPGNDRIDGRAGNDTIAGDSGSDTLAGGAGDDDITGGNTVVITDDEDLGNEIAGSGNDILNGGPGQDLLDGLDGGDYLLGGDDADFLDGPPGDGRTDHLLGGAGADGCRGFSGSPLGGPDPDFFLGCEPVGFTSLKIGLVVDVAANTVSGKTELAL